jgi:hypothetical protein
MEPVRPYIVELNMQAEQSKSLYPGPLPDYTTEELIEAIWTKMPAGSLVSVTSHSLYIKREWHSGIFVHRLPLNLQALVTRDPVEVLRRLSELAYGRPDALSLDP